MASNCGLLNDDGGRSFSYQNRSPFLVLANWLASKQAKVGPTSAPGSGDSNKPPTLKSMSDECLKKKQAQIRNYLFFVLRILFFNVRSIVNIYFIIGKELPILDYRDLPRKFVLVKQGLKMKGD